MRLVILHYAFCIGLLVLVDGSYVRAKSLRRVGFRNKYTNIIMTAKGPLPL
jgi:hypothetical protein